MGKQPKYMVYLQREEEQAVKEKQAYDQYSLARKINKSSTLVLFNLILTDPKIRKSVSSQMYKSNPGYDEWCNIASYVDDKKYKPEYLKVLEDILKKTDSFLWRKGNFSSLRYFLSLRNDGYIKDFVRPIENWVPKSRNATEQIHSLIRHLFAKYPTPEFLEKCFLKVDFEGVLLYIHMGGGHSLKSYDCYPKGMVIHNKAAQHFFTTPPDMEFFVALRRAQILYMGGDEYVFNAMMRSNILRERTSLRNEEFWLTVIKFFVDNTMIAPNKIAEVVDYIDNMKFQRRNVVVNGAVNHEPPHPNFSMKGRNPQTLIEQSDEWHFHLARLQRINRQLAGGGRYNKEVKDYKWLGIRVNNGSFQRAKKVKFTVTQLLSFFELRDEGNYMKHCVASYAQYCSNGRSAIFSVREFIDNVFVDRVATIEIKENVIVQIRGKCNRKVSDETMKVIREWAQKEYLDISKYAA